MTDLIPQFGGTLWTLAAFFIALAVIVTVHEFGHYYIGRLSGIRAEVFSVGFGPRLISRRDRRGTLWQLAAIPLGGYVRFLGDANAASAGPGRAVDPALRRQTLTGAPLWARFATLLAGPVFNFILSILVFGGFALFQGLPVDEPQVGTIAEAPPGVVNELQPGDRILALGGQPVESWRDIGGIAQTLPVADHQDWTVRRDGAELTVRGPDPMPARISGVAPRSAAADAGLRAGDVVMAIDGQPVSRFTQMRQAVEAGAAYGLAPGYDPAVVDAARQSGLPFLPGVMTPSDITLAVAQGCRLMKFFPATAAGGRSMLKNIAAPFAHLGLSFIPTGGVKMETTGD